MGDGVVSAWRGLFRQVARESPPKGDGIPPEPSQLQQDLAGAPKMQRLCGGHGMGKGELWGAGLGRYWGQTPGQTLATTPMKYPHLTDVENKGQREAE